MSGYFVIKMIIKGKVRADVLQTKTELTNDTLRVILAESITLTPGSVMLDLTEDVITVLWLKDTEYTGEINIKGGLEDWLFKVQK